MTRSRAKQRGNGLVEFTLSTIPLIFLLISIFEISRGMWIYHTINYAIQRGARFSIVHGQVCGGASASCAVTVGTVAQVIRDNSAGMDGSQFDVVLTSQSTTQTCAPLSSCYTNTQPWPPSSDSHPGFALTIYGTYPFRTPLSMFWPGSGASHVQGVNLSAKSTEEIRF